MHYGPAIFQLIFTYLDLSHLISKKIPGTQMTNLIEIQVTEYNVSVSQYFKKNTFQKLMWIAEQHLKSESHVTAVIENRPVYIQ